MSAADPIAIVGEVPGRLLVDVTGPFAPPASFPFGGTELGDVADAAWSWAGVYLRHTAEELQIKVVGNLFRGEALSMSFAVRGLDEDAFGAVFPNTRVGAVSQHRVAFGPAPAGVQGGTLTEETGLARPLLFLPDDQQNHDAVLFPRALPQVDEPPKQLHLGGDHVVQCTWLAIPGANGLAYEVGRVVDLTAI